MRADRCVWLADWNRLGGEGTVERYHQEDSKT